MHEDSRERRRRATVIGVVAFAIVAVPLSLTGIWSAQVDDEVDQRVSEVQRALGDLERDEFDTLRHRSLVGPDEFAATVGLGDQWRGTSFGADRVGLAFEVRSGWVFRCIEVTVEPGRATVRTSSGRPCAAPEVV